MVARRRLRTTTPRNRLSQRQRLGRPDVYRPEYCEALMRSGAQGFSLTAFGGSIGVARDTLNQWAKKYPAFAAAKSVAEALACYYWERLLKRLAEEKRGNATAIIFALKNRVPEEWRERVVTEHTGADAGPVRLELDASQLRDLPVDQVRVLEDILQQISVGTGAQLLGSATQARNAAESDDETPASYEDTLH